MRRRRGVIVISGRGSNMDALLEAATDPAYPVEFLLVLSDRADAPGLAHASARGVATAVIPPRDYPGDRAAHDRAMLAELQGWGAELVCLAGYMRVFSPFVVEAFPRRMLNIHPSLLPAFRGLHTHARALAAGVKTHGCTVHLVTAELDGGPILAQAMVPVLADDDEATLAARVLAAEHRLYPQTVRRFAEERFGDA